MTVRIETVGANDMLRAAAPLVGVEELPVGVAVTVAELTAAVELLVVLLLGDIDPLVPRASNVGYA